MEPMEEVDRRSLIWQAKKKKKKWKKLHVRKKDGTDLNGGGLVEASEAPSSD